MNKTSMVEERGLTIMIPEAEILVRSFRANFQSSAASNFPAHITINHPFVPALENFAQVEELLVELFSRFAAFQFTLTEICTFPNVLYLATEPVEQFMALINAVIEASSVNLL